jgi:hypothetical protein
MAPRNTTIITIMFLCQLCSAAAFSGQDADWQLDMINNPSNAQLKVEERGRVFIYDGLHEADVELAMNTQFARLDNMMFVRTKVETPEGEVESEDDGCD